MDWLGEFRSSVYQDSYRHRLFPRYIAASLTVVYSDGKGVVPKGNRMQRKTSYYNIVMHFDVVVLFACIRH